jgi:hypothetical protein
LGGGAAKTESAAEREWGSVEVEERLSGWRAESTDALLPMEGAPLLPEREWGSEEVETVEERLPFGGRGAKSTDALLPTDVPLLSDAADRLPGGAESCST